VEKTPGAETKRTSASNGSGSPDGGTGGSSRLSSYLQSVAQISGVVTIIAATVYALGVFTLVLPISNTYNSTFPAAWYAVSVVPKTVVAGHGITSLVWPSLALTLATTLFALTMLWVLHTLAIGWRLVRATAERPALSLFTILITYAVLSVLTHRLLAAVVVALGGEGVSSQEYAMELQNESIASIIGTYVVILLVWAASLAAGGVYVLAYLAVAVLLVARGLSGTRRLIRSRAFPSMSFRGFLYKGLAFAVLTSMFLFYVGAFVEVLQSTGRLQYLGDYLLVGVVPSVGIAVLFGLAVAVYLMLRLLRYTRKAHLLQEASRSRTFSSILAPLRDLRASLGQRVRMVSPTVLYSMVLFWVLYLALFVAINTLFFSGFLLDEVRAEIKSETWLDETFLPLVVFGALVSVVIMYRKDWKDLGSYEVALAARASWRHFLIGLLKSIGARSFRRGLLLSLVVAYVIALASAFLLAQLRPPPLPKVEVNKFAQAESGQPGQEPDFQGKTLALLAHTEGYWYLIDEDEGHLLVVPDQTDKFIRLRLDEQPK
jgi:hypothetical protein